MLHFATPTHTVRERQRESKGGEKTEKSMSRKGVVRWYGNGRVTGDLEQVHENKGIKGEAGSIKQTNEGVGETIKT